MKQIDAGTGTSETALTMDTYGHLFPGQEAQAVGHLEEWMGSCHTPPADIESADPPGGPNESNSGYDSTRSASQCMEGATRCNNDRQRQPAAEDRIPEKTGARSDPVRPGTMPCYPTAPLAQLAEQLTLNQ